MSERFLDELAARLESYGVRGTSARRVLAEARDHLHEAGGKDPDPATRFGDLDEIARLIAAELATSRTRRATFVSFAALCVTGIAYVVVFALQPAAAGSPDIFSGRFVALGLLAGIGMVVLPQIAFVSGCLALLRAIRLRSAHAVPHAELGLLRQRSNVALATAAGTLLAFGTYALDFRGELASWWTWSALAACAALAVPLGAAAVTVTNSACPAGAPGGRAEDVFDDLEPLLQAPLVRRFELPRHPWRFALLSAGAVGTVVFAAGWYAEGDPGSGIVRGGFETVALLVCFAVLGRKLGLRRTRA